MLRDTIAVPTFSAFRAADGSTEPWGADAPIRNELLRALPGEALAKLRPFLEPLWITERELLFDAGAHIGHVYFPETAVVSLVRVLRHGGDVEVGTAGREGMIGLSVALGDSASPLRARAQIAGTARRMSVRHLSRLMSGRGAFPRAVHRYGQAFLTQSAQTTACNGAHLVQERCARWLLVTRDRVDAEVFPLGAEPLAQTLGVRQTGVTAALRALQDAGLVRCEQGMVTIRDHAGLERLSCECYGVVRSHFAHVFPPLA